MNFTVETKSGTDDVAVKLYKYTGRAYQAVDLTSVLDTQPALSSTTRTWTPKVQSEAPAGTYRLSFQYYDKTEYWDFIIK